MSAQSHKPNKGTGKPKVDRSKFVESICSKALRATDGGSFLPSKFMAAALEELAIQLKALKETDNSGKSLRGHVFQRLVAESLRRSGVAPVYTEAYVTFVPVARFDIIIPTREQGIVNLSVKTTMRERWKQAEFEGVALKRVHRRSRVYVVNYDVRETNARRERINECEAIDDFILCQSTDFDLLVEAILRWIPEAFEEVPVISPDGRRHPLDARLCEASNTQRVRAGFGAGADEPARKPPRGTRRRRTDTGA
jgi:hypothetical protein